MRKDVSSRVRYRDGFEIDRVEGDGPKPRSTGADRVDDGSLEGFLPDIDLKIQVGVDRFQVQIGRVVSLGVGEGEIVPAGRLGGCAHVVSLRIAGSGH